ncbi:MAG TPA: AAA family ATPase [Solirubrobacterales bacterium]
MQRLPGRGRNTDLLGRDGECAVLDEVAVAIQRGESRSLVLRGEAGIGKTALLEHLIASASGSAVFRADGVESEMELAFATLQQLCAPLLDRLGKLPAPQSEALEVAFGERAGAPPDRFLIGLAVLGLFSELAEERPLLCVVDDAQWVDQASALTLAFVARRLQAEPIGIVFAAREPGEELRHLSELEVRGLRDDEARALLTSQAPSLLDERVRDRIVAEVRGNPLALLELPRGLTSTELAVGFTLPTAEALPGRIEESYARRFQALAKDTRHLLLLAAADPLGDPLLLQRASEHLGIPATAIDGTDGLLGIGERVTFRHPLVRSAVYRSADAAARRSAHLALAEVTDRELDPDRRAWHLASAAAAPDEAVAVELERSAGRAQGRGGLAAAAAFLQRALALTADPARRADRALAAAEASLSAGAFDAARGLLAVAESRPMDDLQRARVDLLAAEAAYSESRGGEAPARLLRAARALEPLDPVLARETHLDAWSSALFAGRLAGPTGLREVSEEARAAPRPDRDLRPSDLLLDGFALAFTDGRAEATPVLERAAVGFAGDDVTIEEVLRWGWLATAAAVMAWDYEKCAEIAARGVDLARREGALTVLAVSLNVLAQALALGGESGSVAARVAEADAVTEATGTRVAPYGALVSAGFRGSEAEASALIDATIEEATAGGQGTAVQYAHWANAVLLNGLGRYPEALAAATEATADTPELFVSAWAASELVEAASRSDEMKAARSALERVVAATAVAENDWALGIRARARALVSEPDDAEPLYREAVERLGRTRLRPDFARAQLLYGEWLRRENRRADARAQLRAAHDLLVAMDMHAFAERARVELLATGEKVRKRTVQTRDQLTPQELNIARLARDGLSNPEIGGQLFLSPRTVEWHLRKVFAKLEIRSRRELVNVLPAESEALSSRA